ncbi:MAG TPA: hypothetical protein VF257_06435 [Solirubrobacteraceae bacterium]
MRGALASLVTTVALLGSAAPALADSASLSVTTSTGQADPVAYIPRIFTVSGSASGAGKHLYIKHRAAGGAACAPSAYTDSGTFLDASFYGVPVTGAFSLQRILTWRAPGTWMLCFWLATDETAIATPATQTITVRTPAANIGATVSPNPVRAGDRARIAVAGTTEAPRRVYAKIRPADGPSCGPSFDADPGGEMVDGWSVDGAFSIDAYVNDPVVGRYLVCMWLAGSSDDGAPVAGPQAQIFDVVRGRPVVVSSAVALNCKTKRVIRHIGHAGRVKSVCMRYRFSSPPAEGERLFVSYVSPKRGTYKTVRATWPAGQARTLTTATLPARAYKHRRGLWRAILRVGGKQVRSTAFRVT